MNLTSNLAAAVDRERKRAQRGSARTILLFLFACLLGLGICALWLRRPSHSSPGSGEPVALSEPTKALLRSLNSPLEIRFYSILDPASINSSMPAFAGHVDQLLSAYQQQVPDKIRVNRINSASAGGAKAAAADGIKAFNLEKGDACYLGIAVAYKGRAESLPQLAPEWEAALESDLSRAITHLVDATEPTKTTGAATQTEASAAQDVKRIVPNLDSVSIEEGKRILREASLKEFKAAATELQSQVKEAQQRLIQAQQSGSEAEQQAAMKNLQQLQSAQMQKLKELADKAKAEIQALEHLKAAGR
jgi:hypothetical protein